MKKLLLFAAMMLLSFFVPQFSPVRAAEGDYDFENENNFDALQRHWAEMIYRFFPCVFDHRPIEGCNDLLSAEELRHNQDIEDRYRYRLLINKEDRKHYIRRRLYNLPYLRLFQQLW